MIALTDPVTGEVKWVDAEVVPTEAPKTVDSLPSATASTAKIPEIGVDFDPYDDPGERAEGMFIGKFIGKFTGETDGFCSTYREWHIFVQGMYAGFRAPTLGAVPAVPHLWADESQYYEGAAMVTNVIKCQWPTVVAGIAAIAAGSYTGIIPAGTLSSIATALMHMIPVL